MTTSCDCRKMVADYRSAMFFPPRNDLERMLLFARVRSYTVRFQYLMWNVLGVSAMYIWDDHLLHQWWFVQDYIFINIIFHIFQMGSMILYAFTTFSDPGFVPLFTTEEQKSFENKIIRLEQTRAAAAATASGSPSASSSASTITNSNINNNKMTNEMESKSVSEEKGEEKDENGGEDDDDAETSRMIKNNTNNNDDTSSHLPIVRLSKTRMPEHFCYRCKFLRPVRSKHCYDCDRCVMKFDHHCPFMGNCIGGYNHRYFVMFTWLESVTAVWATLMILDTLFNRDTSIYSQRTAIGWISRVLFLILIVFGTFAVVSLAFFHTYLMLTGQTTYEMMKPQIINRYIHPEEEMHVIQSNRNMKHENSNNDVVIDMENYNSNNNNNNNNNNIGNNSRQTNVTRRSPNGGLKNVHNSSGGDENIEMNAPIITSTPINEMINRPLVNGEKGNADQNQIGPETETCTNVSVGAALSRSKSGYGNLPPYPQIIPRVFPAVANPPPYRVVNHPYQFGQYFNEGLMRNFQRFFRADLKTEWSIPQPAVVQ